MQGGPGQAGMPGPPGPQGAAVSDHSTGACVFCRRTVRQRRQKKKHMQINSHCHSDHVEAQSVLLNSTKPEHRQGKPA